VESKSSVAKLTAPAGIHELGCAHRKKSSKGFGEKIQPQINANERKSIQEKSTRMNRPFRFACGKKEDIE